MGQESCKSTWPKPSGGYQTITGRRYGRRHAYIGFRPALESPHRSSTSQGIESEGLELDSVQMEKDLISKESLDSSLISLGSVLSADLKEDARTLDANGSLAVFTEAEQNAISPFPVSKHIPRCQTQSNTTDCVESRRSLIKHASVDHHHSPQNAISFVNIDSFEPDSSDGEDGAGLYDDEDENQDTGKHRKTVNCVLPGFHNDPYSIVSDISSRNPKCLKDSLSQVKSASLATYSNIDMFTTPWSLSASSVSEDEATGVNGSILCDTQRKQEGPELAIRSSVSECNETNTGSNKTDLTNEPVVRPKIRKQVPASSSRKEQLMSEETRKEAKSSRRGIRETQGKVEKNSKDGKTVSIKESNSASLEGAQEKGGNNDCITLQDEKLVVDDAFWDDFEVYGMKLSDCPKDDDSSYCSDGEWSTCLPSYFSRDKDHSSSDESWETLPGKEEHEVQSNSSSIEDENSEFCFQVESTDRGKKTTIRNTLEAPIREQNSLEDGEILWLQYREDIESSTDEETELGPHYLPPGFFILDGNNNLEDDSSMSEDLDVEWRLLDDFGDGIGVAQAMSYMDSQFLTYMALEERLAQAMETALAHLESLTVDVEQAHPPATKESIECLPQITVMDDHNMVGQEQCCAICCSEYIKDEILTELPCHHLFHKPCVTLWLQKSGTCPVCRHVLASLLPEAAATTSFLSDHDSPPSIHNAAGTR